jgi:hypothetical protein
VALLANFAAQGSVALSPKIGGAYFSSLLLFNNQPQANLDICDQQ